MSNLEILFAAIIVMAIVAGLLHTVSRKPKPTPPPTLQAMWEEALFDARRQLRLFQMEKDTLEGNIAAMCERAKRMEENLGRASKLPQAPVAVGSTTAGYQSGLHVRHDAVGGEGELS